MTRYRMEAVEVMPHASQMSISSRGLCGGQRDSTDDGGHMKGQHKRTFSVTLLFCIMSYILVKTLICD